MKRAETKKWNGGKKIPPKTQDIIDPFLAGLYNPFSLSSSLTEPYQDCTIPPPSTILFTIDVAFIPEGETDNCKLEVLLHDDCQVVLFIWKVFEKHGSFIFMRKSMTTWKLEITNGNKYLIEYHISENKMTTDAGELEKSVGWPSKRMEIQDMIEETKSKVDKRCKSLSSKRRSAHGTFDDL